VGATPVRPDHSGTPPSTRPVWPSAVPWIAIAALVGFVGLQVIVQIRDASGKVPPTSMFAAAGLLMSVVAMVTVTVAAWRSGIALRAAIALGGGFAAIAVAKFAIGPTALYHGLAKTEIQDPLGLGARGSVWAIAVVVCLLYTGVILLIASWLRPASSHSPRVSTGVVLIALALVGIVVGAFLNDAPINYLGFALTGVGATALAIALFVAATLVGVALRDTAKQAKAVGTASVYLTVVWVAIAFVLVFQVLWIVFLLAVVTVWPLRTVTPK
jgi:hypothetical protein